MKLVRLRNFWRGDQYKGISSLWRDPAASQLFEVQFHTEISYHAMMFTAEHTYAWLRSAQTCAQQELELEAFQREVYAHVRSRGRRRHSRLSGRRRLAGSRKAGQYGPDEVAHYAWSMTQQPGPAGRPAQAQLSRRRQADEVFTQDLIWHRSSLLISAERGDLENEFIEITAEEAGRVATASGAPP